MFSPFMKILAVDELLKEITGIGYQVDRYADTVMFVVIGPFLQPLTRLTQRASGLAVNPEKTNILLCTRKLFS